MTISVSIPRSILNPTTPLLTVGIIALMTIDGSHVSQETSFDFEFEESTFDLVRIVLQRMFGIDFDQILIW